jgi:pyruvate,water dikinase
MIIAATTDPTGQRHAGGKAGNLFHLLRHGVSVPPLFCVSSDAFYQFIEAEIPAVRTLLNGAGTEGLTHRADAIRHLLAAKAVNPELAAQLASQLAGRSSSAAQERFYSVRSSALAEDSSEHSFAGLFETFLYVREAQVLDRIKQCWLSAYGPNVLQYCLRNHLDPLETRMGVIVQEMIASSRSGIMFTANPTGSLAETVIVAGFGVGEGVVANKVETDVYIYNSETRSLTSTINHKPYGMFLDTRTGSGVAIQEVPVSLRDAPVLQQPAIDQLLAVGRRVSELYTHFQDIEWCIDADGRLFVLQSRPITTIPHGKLTIFDNSNIVESYPGVTTPLSFSIIHRLYRDVLGEAWKRLLCDNKLLRESAGLFEHLVGYVEGRIYYDIINWYEMGKLLPLPGPFLVAAFDNTIGVYRNSDPERFGAKQRRSRLALAVRFWWNFLRYFLFMRLHLSSYKRQFDAFYAAARAVSYESFDLHELQGKVIDILDRYATIASVALINDFFLMIFVGRTKALLRSYGFKEHDDLFNGLMCGEDVESAVPVRSLVEIAEMLRRNAHLHQAMQQVSSKAELEQTLRDPCFAEIATRLSVYLDRYGDRCPQELKIETTTFREDPVRLVKTLLAYVPLDVSVEKTRRNEEVVRGNAEQVVQEHLAGRPARRWILGYCLDRTRNLIANRESARLNRGRAFGLVRRIVRVMGEKLHRDDAIESPPDIFYVPLQELSAFIYGMSLYPDLKELARINRKQVESYHSTVPTDRLLFSGAVGSNVVQQKTSRNETTGGSDRILRGVSCSPGDITAEAIVVHDPAEAPDVAGKIIVAQMTDPGWIFLMIVAAGLIVEKGSVLSHTAIIGREFGIPTIVGVKDATRRIKSGTEIKMRAGVGEVELCS